MKVICINNILKYGYRVISNRVIIISWYREDAYTINFCENIFFHREDGAARIFVNKYSIKPVTYVNMGRYFYYKNKSYGSNNSFTNSSWKRKVKELKREERLKLFV